MTFDSIVFTAVSLAIGIALLVRPQMFVDFITRHADQFESFKLVPRGTSSTGVHRVVIRIVGVVWLVIGVFLIFAAVGGR